MALNAKILAVTMAEHPIIGAILTNTITGIIVHLLSRQTPSHYPAKSIEQSRVRYAVVIVLQTAMDTRHVLIILMLEISYLIIVLLRRVRHIGMNFVQMNAVIQGGIHTVLTIFVTQIMSGIIVPQNSNQKQTRPTFL